VTVVSIVHGGRIAEFDDASARCSASNRLDQPSVSKPVTRPSTPSDPAEVKPFNTGERRLRLEVDRSLFTRLPAVKDRFELTDTTLSLLTLALPVMAGLATLVTGIIVHRVCPALVVGRMDATLRGRRRATVVVEGGREAGAIATADEGVVRLPCREREGSSASGIVRPLRLRSATWRVRQREARDR